VELEDLLDRERREDCMPVRIDQTRHQDPPAAIDYPRAFRRGHVTDGDPLDTIALDKETTPFAQGLWSFHQKAENSRTRLAAWGRRKPLARRLAEQPRVT